MWVANAFWKAGEKNRLLYTAVDKSMAQGKEMFVKS
jgi:hypothetical protein